MLRLNSLLFTLLVLLLRIPTTAQMPSAPVTSTLDQPACTPLLTAPVAQLTQDQVASMQHQLADWPQLARYRNDNAALGEPARGKRRVVFLGDSITDFWGRGRGRFFPDQPWINRGISGQTTPQMLLRFRQDVIALHPAAVVILAGINDIAGNTCAETLPAIEDNFQSMVALAKAAHIRVILSSVLPAAQFPWHPGIDPREEIVALNKWLQHFSAEQKLVYLDYYTAMVGPDGGIRPDLATDGVHPSNAGYALMEPIARAGISKSLAKPYVANP